MRISFALTLAMATAGFVISGAVQGAVRLPSFSKQTSYGEARRSLTAQGWSPVRMPNADRCGEGDPRCQGRPEMERCAGTGLAYCNFTWRRGSTLIVVTTVGEDPYVSQVRCRAGC